MATFHVKHSSAGSAVDPGQIAKIVRQLIQSSDAFLHHASSIVAPEFFAHIETLAANVALWGSRTNLTAHPDDPEEIAFHVIDSVMPLVIAHDDPSGPLANAFSEGRRALDLGSGAGFPGLVLAAASRAHFTLVESRRKRASFLRVAVAGMGLSNVDIDPTRVEVNQLASEFDLVTARAFGDAGEFFELAGAALKPGGLAMLFANPSQRLSLDRAGVSHLSGYIRVPYVVARRGERVDRILAIWRRE